MKLLKKLEISIILGLIFSFLLSISSFSADCNNIRNKILRMHVIANSDSIEDQNLKLKVRDAVLSKGKELFDGSITADEAEDKIKPHINELRDVALTAVRDEGYDYDIEIRVQEDFFKTRVYDNSVTLPAGYYTAVKVIIGEGKGKNWWCVMFPPMCLPAANAECEIDDVLSSEETNIVSNGNKYKLKFKIIEIYEEYVKKYK
jgi:stage II sporulation protein R